MIFRDLLPILAHNGLIVMLCELWISSNIWYSLSRACYVMEHGDIQEWANYLLSVIYGGEACIGMQLRAVQCLCKLTDDLALFEEVSGRTVSHIRFVDIKFTEISSSLYISFLKSCCFWHYISNFLNSDKEHTLRYLRDLQILGLTYSESSFESCDKKELATVVLQAHSQSPQAMSFLVQLCKDYNVHNVSIWDSILLQLIDLAMVSWFFQCLWKGISLWLQNHIVASLLCPF